MAPAGLKNFFLMWTGEVLAHKPALLVAVSSADGGSFPIAELRMSSYKNNRVCYIPDHLIIRNVEQVLNPEPEDNVESADTYFRQRIAYTLGVFASTAGPFAVSAKTAPSIWKPGLAACNQAASRRKGKSGGNSSSRATGR